uniref:Uncharacterized protein n=1 Tax=Anopheles albimanus TaxID=7167 RepID=A0A182FJR1_ANOAL
MQRSSPLYVLSNCGGPSVTAPPLLAPLSSGEQQQQQQQQLYSMLPIDPLSGHPQQQQQQEQHQEQVAEATPLGGRCALKRKLSVSSSETNPDRGYPVAYSSVTVPDSGAKVCKDTVPGLSGASNGVVLTDISSSTWTSTAELLDLDRKSSTGVSGAGGWIGGGNHPVAESCPPTGGGTVDGSPSRNAGADGGVGGGGGGGGGGGPHLAPPLHPTNGIKASERLAQTPEAPEDCKNLSWLLNFKLDDLPNLSPRSNRKQKAKLSASGATGPGDGANVAGTTVATGTTAGGVHVGTGGGGADQQHHVAVAIEEGDLNVGENVTIESSGGKYPKKPPFTYTELIEYALVVHGDLTVAAIYQWISEHFPYYKSHDDRWKNSVRHNLSINPHFRKGRKSSHGSGHLWTISSRNSEENSLAWEHKKQRFQWYFQMEADARVRKSGTGPETMVDDEVAAATASLAQYAQKSPNTQSPVTQTIEIVNPPTSEQNPQQQQQHRLQAHALQQNQAQQQQQHQPHQLTYHPTQTLYADIISNAQFEITATAEEIKHLDEETLNGMGRGTEIQIVRPIQTIQTYEMLDSEYNIADYLNPVPKEEIVQECGLRSVALDPAELGINIPSTNDQDNDMLFDDFSLNYFGSNIMT